MFVMLCFVVLSPSASQYDSFSFDIKLVEPPRGKFFLRFAEVGASMRSVLSVHVQRLKPVISAPSRGCHSGTCADWSNRQDHNQGNKGWGFKICCRYDLITMAWAEVAKP